MIPPGSRRRRKATIRADAIHIEGARIRFDYPCGHYRTETLMERRPGGRRPVSEQYAQRMARWWSKENGGVNVPRCPTCEAKKEEPR